MAVWANVAESLNNSGLEFLAMNDIGFVEYGDFLTKREFRGSAHDHIKTANAADRTKLHELVPVYNLSRAHL